MIQNLIRSFVCQGDIVEINLLDVHKLQLKENKIEFYFLNEYKTIYFSSCLFAQKEFSNIINGVDDKPIIESKEDFVMDDSAVIDIDDI